MLPSEFVAHSTQRSDFQGYSKVSNSLVNSFIKNNNLVALKILFYLSSLDYKMDKKNEIQTIDIDVFSLSSFCDIDYRTLKTNIRTMQKTVLTFITFTSEGVARAETDITLIPYCSYISSNSIQLKLFTKVLDLVLDVTSRFTIIDLNNLMLLRSKHSIVMFKMLEYIDGFSSQVAKRKQYTLNELNGLFGTKYLRIKEFERKILLPVQEELNNHSSLTFIYSFKYDSTPKKGRPSISSVVIDLKSNKNHQPSLF